MQKAKSKMQNETERKRSPARTKRMMLILAAVALALILLVCGMIWWFFSLLGGGAAPEANGGDLETYLSEKWTVFQLRAWDPETGTLELDYPLRFTYAQMEKYGGSLEELRELPAGNLSTVAALKTAAGEDVGATIRKVTVYGVTTDGETAYTVHPDGSVETCWDGS